MKITILAKAICRFIAILIKLPMVFFRELEQKLEQKNYNLYTNTKTVNSQSNLEKEKPELDELSSLSPDYTTKLVVKAI